MSELAIGLLWFVAAVGWYLYAKERAKSRDYATDLAQLIYDYDLDGEDLRRSLNHDEIKEKVYDL